MMLPNNFPIYGNYSAKRKLDDLRRLLQTDLFRTQYMDGGAAARLIATALRSYHGCLGSPLWTEDPFLADLKSQPYRLNLVFAAIFDLVCNIEYLHNRVASTKWIYCHRDRNDLSSISVGYYSFLKQCPQCCLDLGLDTRIAGAQHKPSSHHIGEITTVVTALLLQVVAYAAPKPLRVATVAKQSHDIDAVAFREDLLVLLEIKASPMVTFPLRAVLPRPFTRDTEGTLLEIDQHELITLDFSAYPLSLYLPHTGISIPLPYTASSSWPYDPVEAWVSTPDNFLAFLSSWLQIYNAYKTPKTSRRGRDIVLAYLANGWGDEIDSNKTKPGLGRTDDIKKGTYQLLKFGAYYRAESPDLPIRSALVANLDPVFMFEEYIAKLLDVRWSKEQHFRKVKDAPGYRIISEEALFYLYEAILAFNRPIINDAILSECFDFARTDDALIDGRLDGLLATWN